MIMDFQCKKDVHPRLSLAPQDHSSFLLIKPIKYFKGSTEYTLQTFSTPVFHAIFRETIDMRGSISYLANHSDVCGCFGVHKPAIAKGHQRQHTWPDLAVAICWHQSAASSLPTDEQRDISLFVHPSIRMPEQSEGQSRAAVLEPLMVR